MTRLRLGAAVDVSQHRVWERIAHSFDRSRTRRWPHVERFLAELRPGQRVLDLMAGNGRHVPPALAAGLRVVWLDWSRPLARVAAQRYPAADVVVGDASRLPLADGCIDATVFVAGLHSVPDRAARLAVLRELLRATAAGGVAQVTVWSRDAPRFSTLGEPGKDLDVELPWRADGHDEPRAYHLYTMPSLRNDLAEAGWETVHLDTVAVVHERPDNLVAVVRKA
jgi:SAM-dependent methyltransferase